MEREQHIENPAGTAVEQKPSSENVFELGEKRLTENAKEYIRSLTSIRVKEYGDCNQEELSQRENEYKETVQRLADRIQHFRLVQRMSRNAYRAFRESPTFKNSVQAQADEGVPINTYDFDRAVGLDEGIFFTAGYGLGEGNYANGVALVLSEDQSRQILAQHDTIISTMDVADLAGKYLGVSSSDVRENNEKFNQAVDLYKRHLFGGAHYSRVLAEYVATIHHGDIGDYYRFIQEHHSKMSASLLSPEANRVIMRKGILPLVPEVIARGNKNIVLDDKAEAYSLYKPEEGVQAVSKEALDKFRDPKDDSDAMAMRHLLASRAGLNVGNK